MQPKEVRPRLKFLKWLALAFGALILVAGAVAADLRWFSPLNREWVVNALAKRYQSAVDLKSFNSSLFPSISIAGEGLILRRRDQSQLPPFVSVERFSVDASWLGLLLYPRRFGHVRLDGLVINVPPRHAQTGAGPHPKKKRQIAPFVLGEVFADGTTLNILSATAGKPPHVFDIEKLTLRSAGIGQPMAFEATLTNPRPVGQIQSSGKFGPWDTDDPSQTPVSGRY
ncbi:MAG TPA: hypothetical protein VIX19_16750, partial [Terriglobales bacterium]